MTRAGAGFDPYHKWLGIPPGRDTPTHYQLLGLQPGEADATVIEAAASRQTSFVARFRGGRYDAEAARVLFEIEQARYTLLDPDARRKYEAAVRAKAGRGGRSAGEPLPPRGDGRTVGEESGLAREFGGVMAVIVAGFLVTLAATFYFWDRGGKPTAVAATPAAAAAAEAEVAVAPVADAGPKPADLAIAPDAATPAPEESEPAWISLFDGGSLDGWQPTDFPGAGPVRLEDGACLLGRGENLTGVTWQREPPRGDYELRLEARRVAGGDFFCGLTFPVGGEHCTLIVGGWGGGVVGLSDVDGKDASQNETTRRRSFAMERWYKVRLTVEGRRVKAWIDDAQVVDLDATGKSLSVRREAEPSKPLGVTAWRTAAAVRNIEYRSLSDSATAPSTVKSEPVADVPETARANGVDLPAATDADSEHLFNAMDLTGWRLVVPPTVRDKPDIRDCWTVDAERKVLVGHGSKTYWTHWLETDERFGDFVLSLEWRFPPTGTIDSNGSGIVVRSSGLDRNERNPRGVEIDLRPAHGEEGRMATGGLIAYDVPASNRGGTATPEVRGLVREKPPGPTPAGGWNTCEITCRGDRLTVVINGERVNEGWGLERSPGAICLRSQKSDVEFRNVRIRRLDRGEPPASKASAATS
ncbi:MAG TPA: DUF1080 domain-containing protein, partial [Planctomycetaceae bacterium]